MTSYFEFIKMYKKSKTNFFTKYFAKKPVAESINNSTREAIITLTIAYLKFALIHDCLSTIKRNKTDWKEFSRETKKDINTTLAYVKNIYEEIDKILKPIAESLTD